MQKIHELLSVDVTIYIFKTAAGAVGNIFLTHGFSSSSDYELIYGRLFDRVLSTVTIKYLSLFLSQINGNNACP